MAALGDFERHVLPYVAGAPSPAVDDAVLDAAVEFCRRARVLRRITDPITVKAGRFEYELDAPEPDTQIVRVMAAWLDGREITAVMRPELDGMFPRGWVTATTGSLAGVRVFHAPAPSTLRLVPAPTVDVPKALVLDVAYAPTLQATDVPDRLLNEYAKEIAAGAIALLHSHPSATYADATRSGTYRMDFEAYISRCADDSTRGGAHNTIRTRGDGIV